MNTLLDDFGKDLAFAVRQIWRNPGFTAATALILALGIGATTAIFSALDAVLLEKLPYRDGHELVHVELTSASDASVNIAFSAREYADVKEQNETFSALLEYHSMPFTFHKNDEPRRVLAGVVAADFFDELGIRPALGRLFKTGEDEPGADATVVLSDSYWHKSFGRDPGVLGQKLVLNETAMEVIGVLPPLPAYPDENDAFITISTCPFRSTRGAMNSRRARMVHLYGRLGPGVSREQAEADLSVVVDRLRNEYPSAYQNTRFRVTLTPVKQELTAGIESTLVVLTVSVALALVIACINVANLLLTRQTRRQREIATRLALGAGAGRLTRQLLTESALLSLLGGSLGLVLAFPALGVLKAYVSQITPRATEIAIDGRVLLFTFAVSLVTGLAIGLIPALKAQRQNLANALREGAKSVADGSGQLRKLLIVGQLAIAFVLLTSALLTLRSFVNLNRVDAGFRDEDVMTMTLSLPVRKYRATSPLDFFDPLLERLAAHPAVESAAVANRLPLDGELTRPTFQIEGRPSEEGESENATDFRVVSPSYFRTIGVPLLAGRLLVESDIRESPAVTVISQAMARRYWPDEDPVGQRITLNAQVWIEIVGVVADVRQNGLSTQPTAEMYTSVRQVYNGLMRLLVRTETGGSTIVPDVRRIVREIDPDVPISEVTSLEEIRRTSIASPRLIMTLLTLFAALALVITAMGVAGVLSYTVNQRRREIGIRLALGASAQGVKGLIVRQGMALVFLGLGLGAVGAFVLTRFIANLLFDVAPLDPLTFVAAAAVLLTVAGVAVYLPARQATAGNPMSSLRYE